MIYHADSELTNHLVKASMKKKDCVNEDMLKYAIFVSQIKESMWIIRHFGLLPKLETRARGIMPDLNNIYQMCVEGDKEFKEAFEQTHKVLTTSKPPILGSYTIRLLGKRYFTRTENISMVSLLKVLMCSKVNQAHRELWPLFAGGRYAGCKAAGLDSTCPRDSIYLFNDEDEVETPSKVSSFSELMPASNEGILSTKALAARVFSLQADTEKDSPEIKQLLKEWKTWYTAESIPRPFLELTPKHTEEALCASPTHKKRKTAHIVKNDLKPVMQDLLQSIQGLYDTQEVDFSEDLKNKLNLLTTKYKDLAEMCDFEVPTQIGQTNEDSDSDSETSGNESTKLNSEVDKEDVEDSDDTEGTE